MQYYYFKKFLDDIKKHMFLEGKFVYCWVTWQITYVYTAI